MSARSHTGPMRTTDPGEPPHVHEVTVVTHSVLPAKCDVPFRAEDPVRALNETFSDELMLVDTRDIPGQLGALVNHLAASNYRGIVILMTAFGDVPILFDDPEPVNRKSEVSVLGELVAWAQETAIPAYERATGRPFEPPPFPDMVGISPLIEQARSMLPRVSEHDRAPVLILGASGTGKQVVARGLHEFGPRGPARFVEVNCTALPDTLLESELFGRERGAYTDANTSRKGLVETAENGTLFLDEIGHMSEKLQMALLKVIEQRTFRRVGGDEERTSTARFIAATSRDLEEAIREGAFRGDLFYRLNVFTVNLPDLSDRDADVLLLAHRYAGEYAADYGRTIRGITGQAALMLLQHNWPGNVRELKNITERGVVLHDGEWLDSESLLIEGHAKPTPMERVTTGDEPALTTDAGGTIRVTIPPWGLPLNAVERAVIEAALKAADYNITKTARLLFISRDTLRYRIQKYEIEIPQSG